VHFRDGAKEAPTVMRKENDIKVTARTTGRKKAVALGAIAAAPWLGLAPETANAQGWCGMSLCGCEAPSGFYVSAYSCACGSGGETRSCTYTFAE